MKSIRLAGIITGLTVILILAGCGDTYRPVVLPVPVYGVDPQLQTYVFTLNQGVQQSTGAPCDSTTAESCLGSASDIDVSGDVNMGNFVVGRNPWMGFLIGAASFISNSDSSSVSYYSPLIPGSQPTSSLLPSPAFAMASTTGLSVYAALRDDGSTGSLAVLTSSGTLSSTINSTSSNCSAVSNCVNKPVALAALPDSSKVYVVNQGDSSVTAFSTTGPTATSKMTVGANPVWAIASPDSKFVFVLSYGNANTNATLSVISTATDTVMNVTADLGSASPVPTRPLQNPMVYDDSKTRLYVANPASGKVYVFDTSNLGANSPVLTTVGTVTGLPNGAEPFSIAVLTDSQHKGSDAYVLCGSAGTSDTNVYHIVTSNLGAALVKDSAGNPFVGRGSRGIVASADGAKVYVPNFEPLLDTTHPNITLTAQQPGTNIIRTSDNTLSPAYIKAPFQDAANCQFDTPQPWIGNNTYMPGDTIIPSAGQQQAYQATTTGKSGANAPDFSTCTGDATAGANPATCTVSDGGVTWRPIPYRFCPRQRPIFVFSE